MNNRFSSPHQSACEEENLGSFFQEKSVPSQSHSNPLQHLSSGIGPIDLKKKSKSDDKSKESLEYVPLSASDENALQGPVMQGFGDYMTLKRQKIALQYQSLSDASSQDVKPSSHIFAGLVAFISTSIFIEDTSHLSASRQSHSIDFKYLSRLFILHGGKVTQNISSESITHYVNSALPIYFLRRLEKIASKIRLVNPMWILDCVEKNKKIPTYNYTLKVEGSEPTKDAFDSFLRPASTIEEEPSKIDNQDSILIENEYNEDYGEFEAQEDVPNDFLRMKTSAENPNFVQDYFASSRFHHLASWKIKFQEELKLHIFSLTSNKSEKRSSTTNSRKSSRNKNQPFITSNKLKEYNEAFIDEMERFGNNSEDEEDAAEDFSNTKSNRNKMSKSHGNRSYKENIYVHIDMDAFFVSVATRNDEKLKNCPVAVSHGGPRSLCSSVNYEARKLGLHNGMRMKEAQKICKDAGKELKVVGYDFQEYETVTRQVIDIFLEYIPPNCIYIKSCDEAIFDLTDLFEDQENQFATDKRFEMAAELVEKMRSRIYETTKCTCSAGIGSTLILARFALKNAKPNGIFVAPTFTSFGLNQSQNVSTNLKYSLDMFSALESDKLVSLFYQQSKNLISQQEYENELLEMFDTHHSNAQTNVIWNHHETCSKEATNSNPISYLAQFEIEDLPGLGWRTKPKFGCLTTIGQLQQLSVGQITDILQNGLKTSREDSTTVCVQNTSKSASKIATTLHFACRGIDMKAFPLQNSERKSISVDLSYGVRFDNHTQLSKFVKDVSQELCQRCTKSSLLGKQITVKLWIRCKNAPPTTFLGHGPCDIFSKSSSLKMHTNDIETIYDVAEKLLKVLQPEISEIRGLGISLTQLQKTSTQEATTSHKPSRSITSLFKKILDRKSESSELKTTILDSVDQQKLPQESSNNHSTTTTTTASVPPLNLNNNDDSKKPNTGLKTIDDLITKKIQKLNAKKEKRKRKSASGDDFDDLQAMPKIKKSKTTENDSATESRSKTNPLIVDLTDSGSKHGYSRVAVCIDPSFLETMEKWILQVGSNMSEVHFSILRQFWQIVLSQRNLEDLQKLLRKLIVVSREAEDSFKRFVDDIVLETQKELKIIFGSTLKI